MDDKMSLTTNINNALKSDFIIQMMKRNWESSRSIGVLGNLFGEVYTHMIIHKDGYGFEYYMNQMETLYSKLGTKQIDMEQFDTEKAKVISAVIASKLGIDTSKELSNEEEKAIKDFYLNEFIKNGYVSHSFPETYSESIMTNGLISNPNNRSNTPDEKQWVQETFMSKGVVAPIGGYPYYGGSGIYYEHNYSKIFQHAIYSPEWFSWFTSSDHILSFQSIENSPYILRDQEACKRNVMDLCSNAGLSNEETERVISFYQKNYSEFSSPKLNVGLISKQLVGKSDISKAVPDDLGLLDTITYTMKDKASEYTEHQGNVYYDTISPSDIIFTSIPEANKYIKVEGYNRESKEHLTNPRSNYAIIKRAIKNASRMPSKMVDNVMKAKAMLEEKIQELDKEETTITDSSDLYTFRRNKEQREFTSQNINQISSIKKEIYEIQSKITEERNLSRGISDKSTMTLGRTSKGFANKLILTIISTFISFALFLLVYYLYS